MKRKQPAHPHPSPAHRCAPGLLLLLLLFSGPSLQAWGAPAGAPVGLGGLHIDALEIEAYPQVSLELNAWDANGVPLESLAPGQLSVCLDGGEPRPVTALQAAADAPVWVALVIDISGSMAGEPLQDAQVAAARFIDRLAPQDQVALLAFSDPLEVDAPPDPQRELAFTNEHAAAYDLIEGLQAGGQTHLYNAAARAVGWFGDLPPGHRAVLLLTDGRNESAEVGDPQHAIRMALEQNIPVYVIGLGNQIDLPYLQRLAGETGGYFYAVPGSAELARLFGQMATLLKTRYRVSFQADLPVDGGEHTLALELQHDGAVLMDELRFTLPLMLASPTPLPTDTPTATQAPSATPPPVPTATPLPAPTQAPPTIAPISEPQTASLLGSGMLWLGLLGLLGVATLSVWVFVRRRGAAPQPERCAKCGYDLSGRSGPCPQCGGNRRLPLT